MAESTTIAVLGATGRMGTRILQLARQDDSVRVTQAIDRADHPAIGTDAGLAAGVGELGILLSSGPIGPVDVVIDFSTPAASLALLPAFAEQGTALVVGTTGFSVSERQQIESLAARVPLLISANFSRAVNILVKLVGLASGWLGPAADIEIVERHHRFKVDAPSGTALRLAEAAAQARGLGADSYVYGRQGHTGTRPPDQIGLHALRTGDNPGEHTVVFGLMGECLELSHRALNRDGFVLGALDAAKFLAGKPAGLYSMADLLGGLG